MKFHFKKIFQRIPKLLRTIVPKRLLKIWPRTYLLKVMFQTATVICTISYLLTTRQQKCYPLGQDENLHSAQATLHQFFNPFRSVVQHPWSKNSNQPTSSPAKVNIGKFLFLRVSSGHKGRWRSSIVSCHYCVWDREFDTRSCRSEVNLSEIHSQSEIADLIQL